MSRKETIIIAALVNAGLLVILFVSALKSGDVKEGLEPQPAAAIENTVSELSIKKDIASSGGDEVDQVLSQFVNANSNAMPVVAQQPVPAQNAFAEDLTGFTNPAPTGFEQQVAEPAINYAAPQSEIPPQFVEVKVKKGDFLEKIARAHHTTVEEIMRINQLTSTNLSIGKVLKVVPGKSKKAGAIATTPAAAKAETQTVAAKYYTVKNGDNPWTIAVKNHMKLDELLKLNNLNEEKARHLKPGDRIRIK